jgi:enoyl-CoA hydratase/carnithine racemase
MNNDIVKITKQGRIAVVRFDRGQDPNPLSYQTLKALTLAARSFEDEHEVTVVVLTGRDRVFTAGSDLKDLEAARLFSAPISEKRQAASLGAKMCGAWEALPQITIAAIEGYCLGGGVSLAVSCDFRVLAKSARLSVPELKLGMNMSWQTLPRLTNLVGPARAKRIVLLAEMIPAHQALDWGLADWVVDDGQAFEAALALADKIAAHPPIPVAMTKESINAHATALNRVASYMDHDQLTLTTLAQDHLEGLTAYTQGRKPDFKGE